MRRRRRDATVAVYRPPVPVRLRLRHCSVSKLQKRSNALQSSHGISGDEIDFYVLIGGHADHGFDEIDAVAERPAAIRTGAATAGEVKATLRALHAFGGEITRDDEAFDLAFLQVDERLLQADRGEVGLAGAVL